MYAVAEPRPLVAAQAPLDDRWLADHFDHIWATFFADIPRVNDIKVSFARYWKARLGLISLAQDTRSTYVGVNSYLRDHEVPDFVHTAILAHEIVHYAHGFGSPLPRKYSHPHKGGVVVKDLAARGLINTHRAHLHWIHEHWQRISAKPRVHTLRQSI